MTNADTLEGDGEWFAVPQEGTEDERAALIIEDVE
jgi:hypothetical protein